MPGLDELVTLLNMLRGTLWPPDPEINIPLYVAYISKT